MVLALVACGAPDVRVGTGELAWEALGEGDALTVVHGPQGGYHVLGSVRTAGLNPGTGELDDPSNPTVTFQLTQEGVPLAPFAVSRQGLDALDPARDGATHELIGRLVILDISDDDEVVDREATLEVVVEDAGGLVLTDERTVMLRAHPLNNTAP